MPTNKYLNKNVPRNLAIKPGQTYSIKILQKKKERKNLVNIILEKIPIWVVEEKGIFFALKSAPPPSPFVVFLAGDQFAGKDEEFLTACR